MKNFYKPKKQQNTMELIVRIQEQHALQEREYVNRQTNQPEKFASVGFILQHGDCSFYAEMIQEQARKAGALSKDFYYVATLQAQARPWEDQQGTKRFENRLTLTKLNVL